MKVLIVICVIVLLLQGAAVGFNISSGSGDPPSESELEDLNADEAFPFAAVFERLLDPIRPRLTLPWEERTFAGNAGEERVAYEDGSDDQRVAKFELTAGTGILIRYDCVREGVDCSQAVCLCPAGRQLASRDFQACGDAFPLEDSGRCPADGDRGEIIAYGKTGTFAISGLGAAGGTVRHR